MRKYTIMMLFLGLVAVSSTGMDTIPTRVESVAKKLTDSQLVRMSETAGQDKLVIHFDRLRRHIDSMNAQNILVRDSFIKASLRNDSLSRAILLTLSENALLRQDNEQYRKDWRLASSAVDYLYIFGLVLVASLISQGIYNGYRKYRTP